MHIVMGEMSATVSSDGGVSVLNPLRTLSSTSDTQGDPAPLQAKKPRNSAQQQQQLNGGKNYNLLSSFNFGNPSKTLFYLHQDDPGETDRVTYGQFEHLIRLYGAHLRKRYKVAKGDRVVAQVSKSVDSIALYLAALQTGAVYVPLNTDYKTDEIRYFLLNSEPTLFVCTPEKKIIYEQLVRTFAHNGFLDKKPVAIVDELELAENVHRENGHNLDDTHVGGDGTQDKQDIIASLPIVEKMNADDLASICYTSGTTGQPKGAMITHGNLTSNAKTLCDIWRIEERDVLLHAMPIYHVHGLMVALHTILMSGASVVFLPRFEVDAVVNWLPKTTLMMGVPTYYTRLLQSPKFDRSLVSNMRLFISGSAPLLEGTWREFKERTGHEILERYGMTEGQMVCSNPYDGDRKPGTVGPPLPGVNVRVRNSTLEYVGPNLFKGYWRMPEKTKEEFTDDGYFISGDLAEIGPDGYVRVLGRGKDLVITGGLNVYPKEIENVVDALPGIIESAVIGIPHADFGEAVVAVVVLQNEHQKAEQEKEIIRALKDKIAAFKVPKRVFFEKHLPRNVMGKVLKSELRKTYNKTFVKE